MTRIRGRKLAWACGIAVTVLIPAAAGATHLRQLAAVLPPVFLAENFAIVCAARDPGFLDATHGPLGPVAAYSRHMKGEVVAGLGMDDLFTVLRAAADDAGRRALVALRLLDRSSDPDRVLDQWCATAAKD